MLAYHCIYVCVFVCMSGRVSSCLYVCVRACVFVNVYNPHLFTCIFLCVCVCSREWALWGQKAWQVSTDDGSRWRGAERCQGRRERGGPPHGRAHPTRSS